MSTESNNLLISYRGGWHEQDTTNQQIAPPDASYYFFGQTNSVFASDPFFVSNPDLLHPANWTSSPINQTTLYYKRGKIGNNLDLTYYLNWAGEHALKAGIGYSYLYDNRFTGAPHPCVYIYWNQTNTQLEFPVGVGADPESPYYGAYGYYFNRGSFTSDYGSVWDSSSNNLSLYVQDSQINGFAPTRVRSCMTQIYNESTCNGSILGTTKSSRVAKLDAIIHNSICETLLT